MNERERERKLVPEPDPARGLYGWIRARLRLPKEGQEVYYFGPNIGIHIGKFDSTIETKCWVENEAGECVLEDLPEHVIAAINHNKFRNNDWGVVDTDDAPWWQPYNPERAKSWVPLPPDYRANEDSL